MSNLRVISPDTEAEIAAVRALCWEYHGFLRALSPFDAEIVDMVYPAEKYAALLDRLTEAHAPPDGFMRLALRDGAPVGCGMVHRLSPADAEIKRVYVTDSARGTGTGHALMSSLIAGCRDLGFARILMDTSRPLRAAQRLYTAMGFHPRGPYQEVPSIAEGHLLFFEMRL